MSAWYDCIEWQAIKQAEKKESSKESAKKKSTDDNAK